jgi:hypothetical protein
MTDIQNLPLPANQSLRYRQRRSTDLPPLLKATMTFDNVLKGVNGKVLSNVHSRSPL